MIVIKNGYVINPKSGFEGKADVLIKDDKIVSIGEAEVCEDAEVIDAEVVNAPHVEERSTHVQQAVTPTAQPKRGRPTKSQEPEPATNPAPPEIPKPVDVEEEIPAFVPADDAPEWE